jgi:holliday junction DNA helicase RuvA
MIGSLRGVVLDRSATGEVLVEVAGVGYRVTVAPRTLAALELGGPAFLHIHHHVKEDGQSLYGFLQRPERVTFEALLGAHRVGPALALAILATYEPVELRRIVADGDVAALCLVPGVGKQSAARLIIELKSKLDVPELDVAQVVAGQDAGAGRRGSVVGDVREALTGLGYGADEIREALRDVDGADDASTLLRETLQVLGARRA